MLLFRKVTSLLLAVLLVAGMLPPIHTTAQELETALVEEIAGETEALPQQTLPAVIPETTAAAETMETTAPTEATAETTMPQETTAPAEAEETEPAAETEETQETAEPTEEILVEETVAEECCATAVEVSENDALFESYLYKVFFGLDSVVPMGTLARDELSDADKYFYDELKKQIILIADGQRTSTVVEVEFENTGYDYYDLSFGAVFDALVNDCPYAMYWYGGASGRFSFGTYIFRVCLQPTASYRGDNYDENNPTIDTSRAINAANAAENARGIVAQFRNYEDYDKLCAYADKICSLVKYDYNAANKNNWSVNINPWTLVNVFDNDSSTNVVCEGYAEAFQYLCDLSTFERDIVCISPCGANHKWNIVRIMGQSYLMDLTMGDIGSTAERKAYFLNGGSGSVENGYKIGGFHYWYYDDVIELWGSGDDSILKLASEKYDPATAPEPTTITQEKFEAALDSCGGSYRLSREVCLTADLTVEDVDLTVASNGCILVAPGTELTVSEDASIILESGAELIAETNATVLAFGGITNNGGSMSGKGSILMPEYDAAQGLLTLSGTGEVAGGDLDRFSGAKQLTVGDGITAVGQSGFEGFAELETVSFPVSLAKLGDRAFSGCAELKQITFRGNAPTFQGSGLHFENVTADVYYPLGNDTWTEAVLQNYGGSLNWIASCTNGHMVVTVPGTPPNCVEGGISDGAYCALCGEVLAEQVQLPSNGSHMYSHASDMTCDVCGETNWIEEAFPFTEEEWEVLKLTNEERKAAGLAPLTGFATLQQAGDIRAEELHVAFDHMRPDGTACFTVLDELGLSYWYAGENIAGGYRSAASVVNGWMNSQGHRENILNANFDHIGIGKNQYNWVQLFISGDGYSAIRLLNGDRLGMALGDSLDEQNLVGVLRSNSGIQCYLPLTADDCQGYDSSVLGDQTVTVSVLGVSTTVTVHIHDWVEATCTEAKNCPLCGETEGQALGHEYKETKTKATCTEPACTIQTCQVCGDVQIEENEPALGHKKVIDREVAPTCTQSGLTEGMHCSVCDEVLTPQKTVPALGHAEVTDAGFAPSCVNTGLSDGSHCSRCDAVVVEQEIIPALGHEFAHGYCITCGAEDKADFTLYSGKNLTLKHYDPETGKAYTSRQVTWSVAEEYEPFASMNKNGKLTAKKVFEKVRVEAVATMTVTGQGVSYLVDIYPALTQAEILRDEEAVNGKTLLMDFSEETLTLKSQAYPEDTLANVTWTISDKKNQYAEYEINGDTLTIANPKSKAGTVTIKAAVNAGVKKTVTVQVQFGSFAKTVVIAEPEKTTLRSGESLKLSASITAPETVTKPGIVWSTSDKTAATVSNGKVTAKNVAHPTLVTITATSKDGQASASVKLKIVPKNEGQLVLMQDGAYATNSTHAMNVGETYQVTASRIENGAPISETATWTTSKATVATVENGLITAVGAGTAKITAEANGMKAVINIKVSTLVDDMEITTKDGKNIIDENGEKIVLVSSGKAVNLAANVLTAGANKTVTWEITEGANYAKIATSGKLTANKDLTSVQYITVKATAKDGSGTNATIKVKLLPLATGVQIFQNGTRVRSNTVFVYDIQQGNTLKLNAKVYPAKANQAVQLTSSSKKIAGFNEDGELVCFKTGTVTITAKALDGSNAKTTFKLTIVKKVQSLTLKEGSVLTVTGGKSLKLAPVVEINPSDATNKKLNWKVSDNDAGIKISTSGVLSTKKVTRPVTVNIMVTAQDGSGKMLSFDVTVTPT